MTAPEKPTENQTQSFGEIETIRVALIELVDKRHLSWSQVSGLLEALNRLEQDIVDFRRLKEIARKIFLRENQAL